MNWVVSEQKGKTSSSWILQKNLCSIMADSWTKIFFYCFLPIIYHLCKKNHPWLNQSIYFHMFSPKITIFINFKIPPLPTQVNVKEKKRKVIHTFCSSVSFSIFRIQSSEPVQFVMILLNSGLQNRIHLLGVTPFVLFWNFVGHNWKVES